MDEFLEEEGKLGHGFMSADLLEEIDIGDGDRPRPTFISANLDPKYKQELKSLLREYKDCFAWEYYEMPGLDRSCGTLFTYKTGISAISTRSEAM